MAVSSLDLINDGLIRLGVPPLASLSDRSAQALAADSIYRTTKESLLAEHPWSFGLREVELPKLALEPEELRSSEFDFAYQVPSDNLRILGLQSTDNFRLAGDQLYTNDNKARLVYMRNVGEQKWPAYFIKLVSYSFAAAVAITLTEQTTRAQLMEELAARQRRTARTVDSSQTPPYVFNLMRMYTRRTHNPLSSG